MEDDKRIVHALNRFTFGVRPGDVERVRAMGLDKWFDEQLHPDKIDDGALESRLAPFRTLKMSTREMVENFPPPQVLKAVENGRCLCRTIRLKKRSMNRAWPPRRAPAE